MLAEHLGLPSTYDLILMALRDEFPSLNFDMDEVGIWSVRKIVEKNSDFKLRSGLIVRPVDAFVDVYCDNGEISVFVDKSGEAREYLHININEPNSIEQVTNFIKKHG